MENHRNPRLEQLATGTVFDTKRIYGRNGNIIDRYDSCQRDSTLVFFFVSTMTFLEIAQATTRKKKKIRGPRRRGWSLSHPARRSRGISSLGAGLGWLNWVWRPSPADLSKSGVSSKPTARTGTLFVPTFLPPQKL